MSKINIEDIRNELAKDNWQLITEKYINLDTPMEYRCDEGHQVFLPWKKLREHRNCPICATNQFKEQDQTVIPKKKNTFRILALDQATKITGYAIYDDAQLVKYGTFVIEEGNEIERDSRVRQWLISMIKAWDIDYLGLEGIQYQENFGVTTFETLARLQGILMMTCYDLQKPYKICPTNTWRAHCGVKGRSRSDKKMSMKLLVKKWFDISVSDDCADAIGIGKYVSETTHLKPKLVNWE